VIADCHCHAGPGDGFTAPADTRAGLGLYLRRAERAGIARTVIFAAFHSDYAVANREVARIVSSRPDRFWGFAFVHAQRDRGRVAALVRAAVEEHGFRGLKVHRHDARITREVCEAAERFSLPVLYDPMGEVQSIELLAREFPGLVLIVPHLSSFAGDWGAQRAFIDLLVRYPNVFTDTSGVRDFDLLAEAVRRAGARKVLFGSDGPWLHPALELAKVKLLGLPADQEQLVLGGNLLRILGLEQGAHGGGTRVGPAPIAGSRSATGAGSGPARGAGPGAATGGRAAAAAGGRARPASQGARDSLVSG
jgi:predicted TIM-barrel fold metal-dependent hydrolase